VFDTKIKYQEVDWIDKNKQEKPQGLMEFQRQCKNWEIDQVILLEMWEENQTDSEYEP